MNIDRIILRARERTLLRNELAAAARHLDGIRPTGTGAARARPRCHVNFLERQVFTKLVHQSHAVHVIIRAVFPGDILAVTRKRPGTITGRVTLLPDPPLGKSRIFRKIGADLIGCQFFKFRYLTVIDPRPHQRTFRGIALLLSALPEGIKAPAFAQPYHEIIFDYVFRIRVDGQIRVIVGHLRHRILRRSRPPVVKGQPL